MSKHCRHEDAYSLSSITLQLNTVAALTKSTVSQLGSALGMMDTLTKVTSLQSFALLQACASGDLNQVERLLDEGDGDATSGSMLRNWMGS